MSFIKRADGITIYGGKHDTVRSLRGNNESSTSEDNDWLKIVVASMVQLSDCIDADEELGNEIAMELWGDLYDGDCETLKKQFDEKYFNPAGR